MAKIYYNYTTKDNKKKLYIRDLGDISNVIIRDFDTEESISIDIPKEDFIQMIGILYGDKNEQIMDDNKSRIIELEKIILKKFSQYSDGTNHWAKLAAINVNRFIYENITKK
jgi:hypothetical protein